MENPGPKIEALKKVSLEITVGTVADRMDLIQEPVLVDFVFAVGSFGLTGLEYELAGKKAGDSGTICVEPHHRSEMFGHVLPCEVASRLPGGRIFVRYRVTGIADTTSSEVVHYMASAAGGCGEGCDCGCGGH